MVPRRRAARRRLLVRAVRPALFVGLVVSSLAFTVVHGSVGPVLSEYFVLFSVCAGLMAIISGGLEAPIALHVANNAIVTTSTR